MKPSEIKVGKTYMNRGAGRTERTVLGIGDFEAPWFSSAERPKEPVVKYSQPKISETRNLYLSSFASWAGKEKS